MNTFVDRASSLLDNVSLGWIVRKLVLVLGIVIPIWTFAGSYVIAIADEAVESVLRKHGLDPKTFQQVQKDVGQASSDTKELRSNDMRIESDLATIKAQNRDLQEQQKVIIELLTKH